MNVDGKWMFNKTRDGVWGGDVYDTREQAIAVGREEYPDQDFYVGQCEQITVPTAIGAEDVINMIGNQLDCDYSLELDFSDTFYSGVTAEAEAELQQALDKVVGEWFKKYKFCEGCFVICDAEMISVEDQA